MRTVMTDQTKAVTIKFRLTNSDVSSALARHTFRRMWFLLLLPVIGAVSIVWALLDPGEPAVNLNTGCGLLLAGVFLFVVSPMIQARAIMKSPNCSGLMTLTVSDQGIDFTGELSNATIRWAMVKGVSEMRHAIPIYLKPAGFQIIPKREIPEADLTTFRNVIHLHAPGPRGR
jgi:hypothetical protein